MVNLRGLPSVSPLSHGVTLSINQPVFEAETIEGLEAYSADELSTLFRGARSLQGKVIGTSKGSVQFTYGGSYRDLLSLRSVIAVYALQNFAVPRPKALLGHQHFTRLIQMISEVLALQPRSYQTLHIEAAGSDSSVMTRLKSELAAAAGLTAASVHEKGDLTIRLRRAKGMDGWDALVRLSPRPLATRAWRVCNFEGALNAAVAHVMTHLSPTDDEVFVNLMCGSGSLLIERLISKTRPKSAIGCEIDANTLRCAVENLSAANCLNRASLIQTDATRLPLPPGFATHVVADLPFGQLVGSHQDNRTLYPAVLHEATRIASRDASFVLITHEIRLIEAALHDSAHWQIHKTLPITLSGLHPRIYWLRRTNIRL